MATTSGHEVTHDNDRPLHHSPIDCLILNDEDSTHHNRQLTAEIANGLEDGGLKVKYRERDGLAGENKFSFLTSSLHEVDTVICIITPDTTTRYEGDVGLVVKHPDKKGIIPLLHGVKEESITSSVLKQLLSVNYSLTTDTSDYLSVIINTLRRPRLGKFLPIIKKQSLHKYRDGVLPHIKLYDGWNFPSGRPILEMKNIQIYIYI